MTSSLDDWLTHLAIDAANDLSSRAALDRLSRVNERDHLQPACVRAARAIAARREPAAAVSTGFRFASPLWPRLGAVDIAFVLPDAKPVVVELKCGVGRDALGPCAWDALKLASAIQAGAISAAYLLAATTAADWDAGHRGTELFATQAADTLLLRERFMDWWRHWERLGDPTPSVVPARFETRAVCNVPFDIDRAAWELRLAAVSVDGDSQTGWASTLGAAAPRDQNVS